MKYSFLFLSLFIAFGFTQAQDAFEVSIEETTINGLPELHSFAYAQWDGKWLIIGGRTNGLHGFQPPFGWPNDHRNTSVWVVDPVADQTWSASLASLPESLRDPLYSSNMEYQQEGEKLYLVGGYGYNTPIDDYITFHTLIGIDVPELMDAVINGNPINAYFRQTIDSRLAICGAHLDKIDDTYYLVFGHQFDGRYDREDTTGFFVQAYSYEIRKFEIVDDGTNLSISNYEAIQDSSNFRRRDYNLVPQILPDGSHGLTAFSGVFREGMNLPYFNNIDINAAGYTVNNSFNQYLSQYHSGVMPLYDASANEMHTVFFGGMSMYYTDPQTNLLTVDSLIPFVSTISMVTRDASGIMTEQELPEKMPYLLGTNAQFIPDLNLMNYQNSILDLNDLEGRTKVGYLIGGIASPEANINETDPSASVASPFTYAVYVDKNPNANFQAVEAPLTIKVSPNPTSDYAFFEVQSKTKAVFSLKIYTQDGKFLEELNPQNAPLWESHYFYWDASKYPAGGYYYQLVSEDFNLTEQIIKH